MTLNGHFSRPAETDPYTALDRLNGTLLGSHRRCQDDALSPVLIKINSQLNLPPGRWQVAEWVVRDAAFGQGSWVIAQVNLFLTLFINLKETAGQPAKEKLLNNPFCQLCNQSSRNRRTIPF